MPMRLAAQQAIDIQRDTLVKPTNIIFRGRRRRRVYKDGCGTQEIHMLLHGWSIEGTSAKHEARKTSIGKSESVIVVMKQGNSCGAKGWQVDLAGDRNNVRTQQ